SGAASERVLRCSQEALLPLLDFRHRQAMFPSRLLRGRLALDDAHHERCPSLGRPPLNLLRLSLRVLLVLRHDHLCDRIIPVLLVARLQRGAGYYGAKRVACTRARWRRLAAHASTWTE